MSMSTSTSSPAATAAAVRFSALSGTKNRPPIDGDRCPVAVAADRHTDRRTLTRTQRDHDVFGNNDRRRGLPTQLNRRGESHEDRFWHLAC